MTQLALLGGVPVRSGPFPAYQTIGEPEKAAVNRVMESGVLSRFLGAWHQDFFGGPEIQALEREWAKLYDVGNAIAVNSCTSGLIAAVGAAGCGPGDEVICSPYTMSASATAALVFNAVPVFADIDRDTYNISAQAIRAVITPRTKAIIVVHIFGQAADMDQIMEIASEYNLKVIEDCAQAPFARYKGRMVGSLGHMGVFSLNYHKHIHSGEGGMVTTNDAELTERLQLIRNHAEAVVEKKGVTNLANMIGFNFRMGEIEAAIGRCQILKGELLVRERQDNVRYIEKNLIGLPGLTLPKIGPAGDHVYYIHALSYEEKTTEVPRSIIVQALRAELQPTELREAEGPLIGMGYVRPLYLMPMYQQKMGYGSVQCPFHCPLYDGEAQYGKGQCPNAEEAHFDRLITHELMRPPQSTEDLDDVIAAFHKVFENLEILQNLDI